MDLIKKIAAGCGALGFLCASAAAAPDEAALAAYKAGVYGAAIERAEMLGGADNLALAARALNAIAYFEEDRKAARKVAKRAYELSKDALDEDEANVEAQLQAAIALAVRGANMSPVRAFTLRLPFRSRGYINRALDLAPEDPWALSTSGAWRLEVARRGGDAIMDADPEDGRAELLKAREVAPENVPVAYETALRFLGFGEEAWRAEALLSLDAAIAAPPQTEFETRIQALAVALKAAIDAGPEAEEAFLDEHL